MWSDKLANVAQQWASGCVFAHGQPSDEGGLGQNLYYLAGHFKYLNVTHAIKRWHDEKDDYVFETHKCNGKQCGHYTQVCYQCWGIQPCIFPNILSINYVKKIIKKNNWFYKFNFEQNSFKTR